MARCTRKFSGAGRIADAGAIALLLCAAALAGCGVAPARSGPLRSPSPNDAPASGGAQPANTGNDASPRFDIALALLDQHQFDQAESALLALTRDYPQLSGPATELGLLYLHSNRRTQATQSFEQALRDNPQNTVALNCLGILYRQRGDFARAEQSYLRAIALKPDDAKAHLNLGILYELSLHRPHDALDQYRESQKYSGQDNLLVTAWIKELEPSETSIARSASADAMSAAR